MVSIAQAGDGQSTEMDNWIQGFWNWNFIRNGLMVHYLKIAYFIYLFFSLVLLKLLASLSPLVLPGLIAHLNPFHSTSSSRMAHRKFPWTRWTLPHVHADIRGIRIRDRNSKPSNVKNRHMGTWRTGRNHTHCSERGKSLNVGWRMDWGAVRRRRMNLYFSK